jgi:cytochrome P450
VEESVNEVGVAGSSSPAASEPGAQLRGLVAARVYADFFRDPLRSFADVDRRWGRLCMVHNPLSSRQRRFVLALGPRWNEAVFPDVERFRTTGQGLSGPPGSAIRRVRNGLTRTRGEKHRRLRGLFAPALSRRGVTRVEPRIAEIVRDQVGSWQPGQSRDLVREMGELSLRVSSEVLLGIEDRGLAHAFGVRVRDYLHRSFTLPVLATRLLPLPGTPYRALHNRAERLEEVVREIIAERRQRGLGGDVISAMLRALEDGEPWIEADDIVGQITLLLGASYDTTAQALIWAFFLLAQHPDTGAALAEELDGAGDPAGLDLEMLDALPLLDGVVKETLRLFPPVPYTLRICTAPSTLGSLSLRRGDRVVCSHFFTHRAPECFERPLRFDPWRWQDITPGPFEYMPFSLPPRVCPGAGFSRAVLKRTLAEVLARVRYRVTSPRVDLAVRISLSPRDALHVALEPRSAGFRSSPVRGTIRDAVHWD